MPPSFAISTVLEALLHVREDQLHGPLSVNDVSQIPAQETEHGPLSGLPPEIQWKILRYYYKSLGWIKVVPKLSPLAISRYIQGDLLADGLREASLSFELTCDRGKVWDDPTQAEKTLAYLEDVKMQSGRVSQLQLRMDDQTFIQYLSILHPQTVMRWYAPQTDDKHLTWWDGSLASDKHLKWWRRVSELLPQASSVEIVIFNSYRRRYEQLRDEFTVLFNDDLQWLHVFVSSQPRLKEFKIHCSLECSPSIRVKTLKKQAKLLETKAYEILKGYKKQPSQP